MQLERARRKGLFGGLAGVWLSSTVYGIEVMLRSGRSPLPGWLAVLLAVAVFPLGFLAWRREERRTLYTLAGAAAVLPLVYAGLPCSLLPAAASGALLLMGLRSGGTLLIIYGGAAVGSIGGFLACTSTGNPVLGVVPLAYHTVSIGKAVVRVTGDASYTPLWATAWAALLAASALLGPWPMAVVALDGASRIIEQVLGLDTRLSAKGYGLVETARILAALTVLGLLAPV